MADDVRTYDQNVGMRKVCSIAAFTFDATMSTVTVPKYIHESSPNTLPSIQFPNFPQATSYLRDEVRLDLRKDVDPRNTSRGLHVIDVVTPPRTSSPPDTTPPDIAVLSQVGETILQR